MLKSARNPLSNSMFPWISKGVISQALFVCYMQKNSCEMIQCIFSEVRLSFVKNEKVAKFSRTLKHIDHSYSADIMKNFTILESGLRNCWH